MYNVNSELKPPDVPTLKTPSITPTVPQVSFLFDHLDIQPPQSIPQGIYSGPEFQTFQPNRWDLSPIRPKSPPRLEPTMARSQLSQPSNYDASKSVGSSESNIKATIEESMNMLRKDLPMIIMDCLQQIVPNWRKPCSVVDASTNTEKKERVEIGCQANYSYNDAQTSTEDLALACCSDELDASDSELDACAENGPTFYKHAQEQLQMFIEQAEGGLHKEGESAFASTNKRRLCPTNDLPRPIPIKNHGSVLKAKKMTPDLYRHPTDVSLETDALLRRHLPPDKLTDCRSRYRPEMNAKPGFAVLNMTNVSFAMGYPPDNEGTPIREEYRGYHDTPKNRIHDPPQYSPEWYDEPHNFRHMEPIAPACGYYPSPDRRYNHEVAQDRILDLTAIRRQPKLL